MMRYPIGPFELDTDARRLSVDGRDVPLQPLVFDALVYLARNAPRVVPKEELLDRLWQGVTVSEASLQRVASLMRSALREGGAEALLRSVPRVGYALDITSRTSVPDSRRDAPVALTHTVMARPAICVLPLHIETDAFDGVIADGLVSELIAGLSTWRLFPVISGFTSFRYRDTDKPLGAIAAELDARYVLSGTVRDAAGGFAFRLELADAELNQVLWTTQIRLGADELLHLDSEVSNQIVKAIIPELETAEWQRALRQPPEKAGAWELAMRARWLIERRDLAGYEDAIALCRRAAQLDPSFMLPHALIAFARFQQAMAGWGGDNAVSYHEVFRPTLDAAREALSLDPGSWMAQSLSGVGELWTNNDHVAATAHLDRAVTLNPTASMVYHFAGCIAGFGGNIEKAIYNQAQVFRIDPFYPYMAVVEADLGLWNLVSGNKHEAARWLDRSASRHPTYLRGIQRRIVLTGLSDGISSDLAAQALPPSALSLSQIEASYPFLNDSHRDLFFTNYRRGLDAIGAELHDA